MVLLPPQMALSASSQWLYSIYAYCQSLCKPNTHWNSFIKVNRHSEEWQQQSPCLLAETNKILAITPIKKIGIQRLLSPNLPCLFPKICDFSFLESGREWPKLPETMRKYWKKLFNTHSPLPENCTSTLLTLSYTANKISPETRQMTWCPMDVISVTQFTHSGTLTCSSLRESSV